MSRNITIKKSNFFLLLSSKARSGVDIENFKELDKWIMYLMGYYDIEYGKNNYETLYNDPMFKIINLISNRDINELRRIFSSEKPNDLKIQSTFYFYILTRFLDYSDELISKSKSEKEDIRFILEFINSSIVGIIHDKGQEEWSSKRRITDRSTQSDIDRLVKCYKMYLLEKPISTDKFLKDNIFNAKMTGKIIDKDGKKIEMELTELKKCKGDFKESVQKDFDPYFEGMEKYLEDHLPKTYHPFKLSNEYISAYLDECNRIVRKL